MNDTPLGRMPQTCRDLQHQCDSICDRNRSTIRFHRLPKIIPFDKLEGDEVQPLVFPEMVNAGHIVVIEFGGRPSFLLEANDVLRIRRHVRRKDFESDHPAKIEVASFQDGTHATRANRLD